MTWIEQIAFYLGMLADAVAVLAGLAAAMALIFARKKLTKLLRSLTIVRVYHGMSRIERLISQLDPLHYENIQDRAKIRELLHEIQGELTAASAQIPSLRSLSMQLESLTTDRMRMSQSSLRQFVGQLRATIDSLLVETVGSQEDE
jgi:hypothetical protein